MTGSYAAANMRPKKRMKVRTSSQCQSHAYTLKSGHGPGSLGQWNSKHRRGVLPRPARGAIPLYTERLRCAIATCHAVRRCNTQSLRPALPCWASPPLPRAPKARNSRRVIRITPTAISIAASADNSNHRRRARWLRAKSARMAGAAFTSRSEGGAVAKRPRLSGAFVGGKGASCRAPCYVSREFEYYE